MASRRTRNRITVDEPKAKELPKELVATEDSDLDYFRSLLPFDKDHLDDDLVMSSSIFAQIGQKTVEAMSRRDFLKDKIEETEARRANEIREVATGLGEKMTVAAIGAAVTEDEQVKRAHELFRAAAAEFKQWDVLMEAWRSRGFAMKSVVDLITARMRAEGGSSMRG